MLIAYIFNPHKINFKFFLFLPLIGILFMFIGVNVSTMLNLFLPILPDFLAGKTKFYILLLDNEIFNEINVFNFYYASLLLFYFIMLSYNKYFKSKYDILLLKVFGLMLFFFYFLSSFPVFAFRVSEFFGVVLIILIPHFAIIFKEKTVAKITLSLWLTVYLVFIMIGRILNI
jgi:hypothetical protein